MSHPLTAVKERRTLMAVSSADIAKRVGLTVNSWGRLERGERRIYLDKAKAVAAMLECSTDDLAIMPDAAERERLWKIGEKRRAQAGAMSEDEQIKHLVATWDDPDHEDDDD